MRTQVSLHEAVFGLNSLCPGIVHCSPHLHTSLRSLLDQAHCIWGAARGVLFSASLPMFCWLCSPSDSVSHQTSAHLNCTRPGPQAWPIPGCPCPGTSSYLSWHIAVFTSLLRTNSRAVPNVTPHPCSLALPPVFGRAPPLLPGLASSIWQGVPAVTSASSDSNNRAPNAAPALASCGSPCCIPTASATPLLPP